MSATFKITDGVDSVSLIGPAFYISEWRQSGVPFKGDGYWQDPVFSDGRRLNQYRLGNIIENITISQRAVSPDEAIRQINTLARMLLEAAEYSTRPKYGRRALYLEVKAAAESNTRYAKIHAGHVGEYGNPFSQPWLQPDCRVAVTDVTVLIEHGPWMESVPGTDVCQFIAPTGNRIGDTTIDKYVYANLVLNEGFPPPLADAPFAYYKLNETGGTVANNFSIHGDDLDGVHSASNTLADLVFWSDNDPTVFIPITTGYVNIYSTGFNNLFNGDEGSLVAWVNTSGPIWTGGQAAYFVNLQSSTSYLRIYHPITPTNSITWEYDVPGDSNYINTHNEVFTTPPSTQWFSVGMTWSRTSGFIKFYYNGFLVDTQIIAGDAWDGNLTSTTTVIGARTITPNDWAVSNMAHVSFWNSELTEQNMEVLGIQSDDTVFGIDFDAFDCEEIVAYVSNKQNTAKLTHVFHHDTSLATFSSNLLNSTPPYAILPGTIGANDAVYFGIQVTSASGRPGGPFNSLVFDISTVAAATTYTTSWQYWNGSTWTSLPTLANHTSGQILTGAFTIAGINSVHWDQPGDWATNVINGITAHWVRVLVSAVSGTWQQPVVSDHPYTIVKNTLNIPADASGGSIPSLARIIWKNETASDTERVVIGRKSDDFSSSFVSYLNISDEQNAGFVLVTKIHADTSFQDNPTAATGRVLDLTETSGVSGMTDIFRITIFNNIAGAYLGSYKAFMIYNADADALTAEIEFGYRLSTVGGSNDYTILDVGQYIDTTNHTVHELGEITIMPDALYGDSVGNIEFVWRSEISDNMTVDFYALVLIPTDEWFGDFDGVPTGQVVAPQTAVHMDGTRYADRSVVADVRTAAYMPGGAVVGRLAQSHNGPPILPHDRESTFHFLFMTSEGEDYEAIPTQSGRIMVFRNRRYHYGRGDQ